MALENEAWFIHAVNDTVHQLAQQMEQKTRGAYRVREGVVGKTTPFQRIATTSMAAVARDSDTVYANPAQSKRRAVMLDRAVAVLVDEFDEIKTLCNLESEHAQIMVYARNREMDTICLAAAIGSATSVDEALETTSAVVLPAGQIIVDGGTGLTVAKVVSTAEIMNSQDVPTDDRYFFYSAQTMSDLLNNTVVTSSDYNTIQTLARGGFPFDQSWMGFRWRMVATLLPKTGNIRQCIAWQRNAVGVGVGLVKDVEVTQAPHKWNNTQVVLKLSMGAVRIDDAGVVRVDIDESV
jgi:hypothetical protein